MWGARSRLRERWPSATQRAPPRRAMESEDVRAVAAAPAAALQTLAADRVGGRVSRRRAPRLPPLFAGGRQRGTHNSCYGVGESLREGEILVIVLEPPPPPPHRPPPTLPRRHSGSGVLHEKNDVGEQESSKDTPEITIEPVYTTSHHDYWEIRGNTLVRIHRALRLKRLVPTGTKDCSIPASQLEIPRRTVVKGESGRAPSSVLDGWVEARASEARGQTACKGERRFFIKENQQAPFKAPPQRLDQDADASSKLALQDLQLGVPSRRILQISGRRGDACGSGIM